MRAARDTVVRDQPLFRYPTAGGLPARDLTGTTGIAPVRRPVGQTHGVPNSDQPTSAQPWPPAAPPPTPAPSHQQGTPQPEQTWPPQGRPAPGWGAQPPQYGQPQHAPQQNAPQQNAPQQNAPQQYAPQQYGAQQPGAWVAPAPAARTSTADVLPWLAIGAAVVALVASFLTYVRSVFDASTDSAYVVTGWRQHYEGDIDIDATFLLPGIVLALACALLVAAAVLTLQPRARPLGLGLLVVGATLLVGYALDEFLRYLMQRGYDGQEASAGAGLYLLAAAAVAALVVLGLGLRRLTALGSSSR